MLLREHSCTLFEYIVVGWKFKFQLESYRWLWDGQKWAHGREPRCFLWPGKPHGQQQWLWDGGTGMPLCWQHWSGWVWQEGPSKPRPSRLQMGYFSACWQTEKTASQFWHQLCCEPLPEWDALHAAVVPEILAAGGYMGSVLGKGFIPRGILCGFVSYHRTYLLN